MDGKLVGWARAVKSRGRWSAGRPAPLWLFTDPARMPDLLAVVRRLPRGLCGVVFRHDAWPGREALAQQVARICRERRLTLVIAGRPVACRGAGRHLRGGRPAGGQRGLRTASAHDVPALVRGGATRAVFLSPAFATQSHPGSPAMGPVRWAAMARRARSWVMALGGIDGRTAHRLPRWAAGAGAIGALLG